MVFDAETRMTTMQKATLLIIDTDEAVCKMLARVFRGIFCNVLAASTLEDAIKLVQNYDVGYIVSNFNFGNDQPNGFEIAKIIHQQRKPIIKYLVFADTQLKESEIPREVDAVLSKAVAPSRILHAFGLNEC